LDQEVVIAALMAAFVLGDAVSEGRDKALRMLAPRRKLHSLIPPKNCLICKIFSLLVRVGNFAKTRGGAAISSFETIFGAWKSQNSL
jgi:hypothetical protein